MDRKIILSKVDHTLLKQTATWEDIKVVLDEAIINECASACIPPCFVPWANSYVNGNLAICTVIGFPNGYNTTETKVFEAKQAILDGASEIDMVINIGFLKDKQFDLVEREISEISKICKSHISKITLKVIIETCLLTDKEIEKMCFICENAGADYIKTSTGFSTDGANEKVVRIMCDTISKNNLNLKVKASGGIKDFSDAELFLNLGVDRLGTSRLIKSK